MRSQEKSILIDNLLTRAHNWEDIENVIDIVLRSNAKRHIPLGVPLKETYRESSKFGYRKDPINGAKKFHSGLDLASQYASAVYCTAEGKVSFAGNKGGYGKTIIVQHKYGFETYYAHLTYLYTQVGSIVHKGNAIGFVGATGRATGNHLHYEIRKNGVSIDPKKFMTYRIK
ncbi:M23 family metallopeptidase [Porphyromonas gingivicanis]|uniref:M23 family metallopeptidase n=1 Tax=Porphyromonas gingivicanis TaxID=266762 RepID=UPI001F56BE1E|nr:M23 family metallopeptidase [Porphyromonas gingivicanis]